MAFKDDATNEDIVNVMSGKLAQTIFLQRNKEHSYPSLILSAHCISIVEEITSLVSASSSVSSSQDNSVGVKTRKRSAESIKITKWIQNPGSPSNHENPLKK